MRKAEVSHIHNSPTSMGQRHPSSDLSTKIDLTSYCKPICWWGCQPECLLNKRTDHVQTKGKELKSQQDLGFNLTKHHGIFLGLNLIERTNSIFLLTSKFKTVLPSGGWQSQGFPTSFSILSPPFLLRAVCWLLTCGDALGGSWPYITPTTSALCEWQAQYEVIQFNCWQHNYTDLPREMKQESQGK